MMTEAVNITHIVISGTAHWRRRSVAGYWVASCAALKVLVWGESEEDLAAKQLQAVGLAIQHLYSQDILESFLTDRGFEVSVTKGTMMQQVSSGMPPQALGPAFYLPLNHVYAAA